MILLPAPSGMHPVSCRHPVFPDTSPSRPFLDAALGSIYLSKAAEGSDSSKHVCNIPAGL